jgi:glutaredoxin
MKVELLVSHWCPTCPAAEAVWRQVAGERAIDFAVVDISKPEGREIVSKLNLRTVPATVIDGVLQSVGVPSLDAARGLVAAAPVPPRPPRRARSARRCPRSTRAPRSACSATSRTGSSS